VGKRGEGCPKGEGGGTGEGGGPTRLQVLDLKTSVFWGGKEKDLRDYNRISNSGEGLGGKGSGGGEREKTKRR